MNANGKDWMTKKYGYFVLIPNFDFSSQRELLKYGKFVSEKWLFGMCQSLMRFRNIRRMATVETPPNLVNNMR